MIEITPTRAPRPARRRTPPEARRLHQPERLTPSVLAEIDRCLKAHELIKLRLYGIERDDARHCLPKSATALSCAEMQHIGNLLVLWRPNPKDASPEGRTALAPATRRKPKR
jgi:RNA-binding protein